ncbi:hypothetical protein ACWDX6_02790 [Streptomyces sp. NPDC003027]
MKQSAAKTLGVAALGAAFAAAAAGTAAAAAAPAEPAALGLVTQTVPLGDGLTELPVGVSETLVAGEGALGNGLDQGLKAVPGALAHPMESVRVDGATDLLDGAPVGQVTNLLGGLPLGLGL